MDWLEKGTDNRQVRSTDMNAVSSRSHSIFTIIVESSEMGDDGEPIIKKGKLNLVDLAGSERQSKTNATGDSFKEAKSINLSLTTLGNVIHALVDSKKSHVPYRDSKLTKLLMDSLGGNAKTLMFAAIGPAAYNYDESINTLRYANRAKNIKNKPKVNQNPKDAKIMEMQEEIKNLREQLMNMMQGEGVPGLGVAMVKGDDPDALNQYDDLEQKLRQEAEEIERETEKEKQRIMSLKNIDQKKRTELMEEMKLQKQKEEEIRSQKEKIIENLKSKQERILQGQKKNEEELRKYNEDLERMRKEIEDRRSKQEQMQQDIVDAQKMAQELKSKVANQKENVTLKAEALARLNKLVEQQRDQYQDMLDEHQDQIKDLVFFFVIDFY